MDITDVAWIRDSQHHPMLQLRLDGRAAHILSGQRRELTRRGIVKGIDILASEWRRDRASHPFIRGTVEPGLSDTDLAGCTDDPRVFALYEEMCRTIRTGTWEPGPRPLPDQTKAPGGSIAPSAPIAS